MERVRVGIAIALVSIATACSSPTAQATPTSSPATPSPATTPTPSPEASPSAPAFESLVTVPSPDGKHILVESFADPAHPVTLYSLSLTARNVKFISRTEIGYVTTSSSNDPIHGTSLIARMSLTDLKPVPVMAVQGEVMDFAWSPDGISVAYLLYTDAPNLNSGAANQLWLKIGSARPRALTPLIELYGRGISSTDEVTVRFSLDGKYLLMVDTYVAGRAPKSAEQAHFQVRSVPDGKLVWVPPAVLKGSWTTMAAWSHLGDRLYYDDPGSGSAVSPAGVQWWDAPAKVGTLAGGLAWYSPSMSPDDRLVAYGVGMNAKPLVEVRDLQSGSVRVLPGILGSPIFLTNEEVIESHFVPNTQGIGPPYAVGPYFVLNLLTKEETPLPASFRPIDVWPR